MAGGDVAPAAASAAPGSSPKDVAGVDKLFNGARQNLINAQEQLEKLVKYLQANNFAKLAPAVADCWRTTIQSVADMHQMADDWQEQAQKEMEKASKQAQPGSLNTGITNLTTGLARKGRTLGECLQVIREAERVADEELSFDTRPYVKEKVFYEKPRSLQDLQRETNFEFDRFLDDIPQE